MADIVSRPWGCILVDMDLYHALNRGVDKRTLFLDNQDRARFVHDLYEFNSDKPSNHTYRSKMADIVSRPSNFARLVDIHGWCIMDNHYHLLLSERIDGGISLFLRKLNVGYAKYFNERYKRVGTLFQGRTKKILIDTDKHFSHILNYIHFNPLDQINNAREWRSRKVHNVNEALEHLKKYRWSSFLDYSEIRNFPSILTTSLFRDVFNNNYREQAERYLCDISKQKIQHITLE